MPLSSHASPPKNRRPVELPILRLEVEHADGVLVLDPNGACMLALSTPSRLRALAPVPGRVSDLSGEPAILYRSLDLEVALTGQELVHLFNLALPPESYFALCERYGMAHEWHDDFYDEVTGLALQPRN